MMPVASKDIVPPAPPRPLTEDERRLLLDWVKAAKRCTAFVAERRTDDPAIYRRIVVARRNTNQAFRLIHPMSSSAGWIMQSVGRAERTEAFPTLLAALNAIEPVVLPARLADPSRVPAPPAATYGPKRRVSAIAMAMRVAGWVGAFAVMLAVSGWLARNTGSADDSAAEIAEKVVQDSVRDPPGTQFRNVTAYRAGIDNERWVCGWVNAKDSDGAFLGYRRFVVHVLLNDRSAPGEASTLRAHLLTSEAEVPSMSYAWENYCR